MKKILTPFLILIVSLQLLNAQNIKKANNLFENRSYLKAAELYMNEDIKTNEVVQRLGDCYYFNNNMKEAVKWYKLLLKDQSTNGELDNTYVFRYSQALKGVGDTKESDKWYKIYDENKENGSSQSINTEAFITELNKRNERPYIIHTVSSNSEASDFGSAINGNVIIFSSSRGEGATYDWNDQAYLDLYEGTLDDNGDISDIRLFSEDINTKVHESNAVFTKDGKTIYFTRNNFIDGKKKRDANKVGNLKIYKAELVDGTWSNITELPFNNDNYSVEHPALSPDEKQLFFSSDMPGTIGSFDIFVVDIEETGYGSPKNMGESINTIEREQFPFISSTNALYFASDGHFGLGGLDIFKSEYKNGNYSEPVNLSNIINSNLDDFSFTINEEEETGYFSSNRTGGVGDDDIYRFTQFKRHFVKGVVKKKNSSEILPGTLVSLKDENSVEISKIIVGSDASFSLEIEPNKSYLLKGSLTAYNPSEISFSTNSKGDIDRDILLELESYVEVEEIVVVEREKLQIKVNPIFFYFDSWWITPEAEVELAEILRVMNKYPDMIVEIGAHTDSRGEEEYNLYLSEQRANSVREYLVSKGIPTENIKSKGYGESQLLNRCADDVRCWEREHYENRRCEFLIVN